MNRRGFLSSLAAPLLVKPTLEEIERLTWRRRLFPGWPPPLATFEIVGETHIPPHLPIALDNASHFLVVGEIFTISSVYRINPPRR